jgi:hypothetical protein
MSVANEGPSLGSILRKALVGLPLMREDPYLSMQAGNLGMVDDFLSDLEASVLREYHEIDRTPVESAAFLSALSQLWIFGVYELLRTWRQRVRDALALDRKLGQSSGSEREEILLKTREEIAAASPYSEGRQAIQWSTVERIATDVSYVESLRTAADKSESVFRRIEALRVHLAKHEVPKLKGSLAFSPGYGRIHMQTGSIYYQFEVRPPQVDVLSRRDVADACRALPLDRAKSMLPERVRSQMQSITEIGYGAKQVTVTLKDGSEFEDVFVLWDREVSSVGMFSELPFDARDIVAVREASR